MTNMQRYNTAMIKCDHDMAWAIEREHGLNGYAPELVSVGLKAIDQGHEPHQAIEDYITQVAIERNL